MAKSFMNIKFKNIAEFIKLFSDTEIDHIQIKNKFFMKNKEILKINQKINETSDVKTESVGLLLGENDKDGFKPSLALLEILAKKSNRKVFLNKKAAWLFLCGRDVFADGVITSHVKFDKDVVDKYSKENKNSNNRLVLVQNQDDENIGLGKIVGNIKDKVNVYLKNILDRGDYLRRERMKKY